MFFDTRQKINPRRVILLVGDILSIAFSISLSACIRLSYYEGLAYVAEHIPTLVGSGLIFLLIYYIGGMYEPQALTRKGSLVLSSVTVGVALVIVVLAFYARFQLNVGRGILLLAGLFIFFSTWSLRHLYRLAVGYGFLAKNTLIVGLDEEVADAVRLLTRMEDPGYKLFGIVSCEVGHSGEFLEGIPILGHIDRLREFVQVYSIESLIVAPSLVKDHAMLRVLRPLRYAGIEVIDYVSLHEELAQEILLDHIDDEWLMKAALNSSVIHIRKMKRIMDITVSVLGLVLLAPVALLTAIIIKMDSAGPVLFKQHRAGYEGWVYTLLKFRTMKHGAEAESGAVWSEPFDKRVTRVGRFLRKWRIDEIPQLINVLRGEMSLVGPRPERPEFIDMLTEAIPFYRERLLVSPGISGWAQVMYPYAASVESARKKLQYDLYYIKHMSFFLDCLILLKTLKTIIVGLRYNEEDEDDETPSGKVITLNPADRGKGIQTA